MSTGENKAIVRRFITEVLGGGDAKAVDELLAPNYFNRAMGLDLAGFKAMRAAMSTVPGEGRYEVNNLVAEDDAVVARLTIELTMPNGETISARGLTYYGLADGKIVEDDPMMTPDLMQKFAEMMPTPGI